MMRRRDKRPLIIGAFMAAFVFGFLTARFKPTTEPVDAASTAGFDAGNIISDYVMSNYSSMTEAEIQAFLTSKNSCSNTSYSDYQYYTAKYPNLKWHWQDGHFVCLSQELFGDGEVIGSGETAAHIIWQAAQDYRINPQVLIVLLQKEQGLITDTYPNDRQYRAATGYGCPDTAACSTKYYGFKNQVRNAAAMFRTVLDGGWTNYPLGENYIQYNPDANCGGSVVNIKSLATSALHRYTPYQPNAGALAAGYGTAYCGSYGNRNFYNYFTDWFGNTNTSGWQKMTQARIMIITQHTSMINPITNDFYGTMFGEVGEQYYFTSKIDVMHDGQRVACLRTEEDTNKSIDRCMLLIRMRELSQEDIQNIPKTVLKVQNNTYKYDIGTMTKGQSITTNTYQLIEFASKITINNDIYYRTSYDDANKNFLFIPAADLSTDIFANFVTPRNLFISHDVTPKSFDGTNCENIPAGTVKKFTTKIDFGGLTYYRTAEDTASSVACAIPSNDLTELSSISFMPFMLPRELKFQSETSSTNLLTHDECENIPAGTVKKFTTKIDFGGLTYYRTAEDTEKNSYCVTLSTDLAEL